MDDIHVAIDEREGGRVATVTVDYEQRLNILDRGRSERLRDVFRGLASDEVLRVAVLTGAGDRAFIGGADVNELVALNPESAATFIRTLHEACQAIRDLPVPVIASIRGYCLGAGLELAAACDLRVASDDASFGMPEVAVGIPSVIEAALLPPLVGWGRTRELVFLGGRWDAFEARAAGLLQRVTTAADLDAAVGEWTAAIVANAPRAIRAQKALLREWESRPLSEAIEAGIRTFAESYRHDEPREYMRRFLDRRR